MTIDTAVLRSIASQPIELVIYLLGSGWSLRGATDDEALWFRADERGEWELISPIGSPTPSAIRRTDEALSVLCTVENRALDDIAHDVESSQRDQLRVRTFPATPSGSAPLREAIATANATREMLVAAAASVGDPREIFASRKVERAVQYADSIAVSTEPGSFVLALEMPIGPSLQLPELLEQLTVHDGLFPDDSVPFNRRATERVVEAAGAAAVAASSDGHHDEAFSNAVESGVSANFLEALAALGGLDPDRQEDVSEQRFRAFEIGVRWSYGRPSAIPAGVTGFAPSLAPVFSSAARAMRVRHPEPDALVQGRVVALRDEDDGGTITVESEIADGVEVRLRPVRIRLLAEEYAMASNAHAAGYRVQARGELHRSGQLGLRRVKHFEVLDPSRTAPAFE